ncbi:MAG: hypothetical protein WB809_02675 [Thermoplasmata archaeon]
MALGLTTVVLGLFLLFAGCVHIGCSIGGSASNPSLTNCDGATDLEFAGIALIVVAVVRFAGSFVPDSSSRYK